MSAEHDQPSGSGGPEPPEKKDEWLPPRLRQRLQEAEQPPPKSSNALGWIVVVLVIAGAIGGGAWLIHNNQARSKAAAAARAEQAARERASADSIAKARTADSLAAAARADSVKSFLALPAWKQRRILLAEGTPQALERARALGAQAGPFVIDAGSYLFEDPAKAAAAGLRARTGLDIRVVPVASEGSTMYHLYAGMYDDQDRAHADANKLLAYGAVQAAIVPAPRTR